MFFTFFSHKTIYKFLRGVYSYFHKQEKGNKMYLSQKVSKDPHGDYENENNNFSYRLKGLTDDFNSFEELVEDLEEDKDALEEQEGQTFEVWQRDTWSFPDGSSDSISSHFLDITIKNKKVTW